MSDNKLGATGKFPQGKLKEDDKGEVQFAVMISNGKLVIDFGTPVHWIGFGKEDAEKLVNLLQEKIKNM